MTETKEMTRLEMLAEMERLKTESARLKALVGKVNTLKISQKGAVSVYGFGRFPITLYARQFVDLLQMKEEILAFIEANREQLEWDKKKATEEPKA